MSLPMMTRYAETNLPTRHGTFAVTVFRDAENNEHLAISKGDLRGAEMVLTRVHSECFTSEVLGSLKCDCREQLELALESVAKAGRGVVIYLRQEGRGIGLGNKIRAYALQESGADTIEANVKLGLPVDARRYDLAAAILQQLQVRSIQLMTNNPDKAAQLEQFGVQVAGRVESHIAANEHSLGYLDTKRDKMGHWIKKSLKVG